MQANAITLSETPTIKYLGVCQTCVRPVRATSEDGQRFITVSCPECNGAITVERLVAVTTAEDCHAQCVNATGPSCSCSCGGANHGGRWDLNRETTLETESALEAYRARIAADDAKKAKRAKAKADRERRAFDAWVAEAEGRRELVDWLADQRYAANDFLVDMADMVVRHKPLTERQEAASARCMSREKAREQQRAEREDKEAARAAAAVPVPTGKAITVEGEIVYVKVDDNPFTYRGVRTRMLVEGAGWKVWATVPAALANVVGSHVQELKGRRVRFVADVEVSWGGDVTVGNAKRPRQAAVVEDVRAA